MNDSLVPVIVVDRTYTDEPALIQGAISPTEVSTALPAKTRHWEPCVRIRMKNGERLICVGTPTNFLNKTIVETPQIIGKIETAEPKSEPQNA